MPHTLHISIRFLDPTFHGRLDGGEPEWPPSPLRVYQALVAAAGARWRGNLFVEYAAPALEWLAKLPAPTVVAAVSVASDVKYRMYVPDNVADKVAKSWRGGNTTASIADYRTEKDVRPTHLTGDAVHYLYPIADGDTGFATHKETLVAAARSVTHLGWGVDMVAGNAVEMTAEDAAKLTGERWRPTADGSGTPLRAPRAGTLAALMDKHAAFLGRLQDDGFKPVPPLTAFDTVGYRRDTDPAAREFVAFRIASVDPDAANPSFDTPRHCRDVAAWVRHATGGMREGWPFPNFDAFVHGHTENGAQTQGERADERFMYLPLPTINHALGRVESIRRVLIAAPPGFQDRIDWIRRRLPGQELVWGSEVKGMLLALPDSDWVLAQYIGPKKGARTWSTVTPVVLPGYDDRDAATAERLLRRAFGHAGFSEEVLRALTVEWRNVGFRAGVDLASKYCLPDRLNGPRYHVRVQFAHPVRGPLAVGAGRYRGLGLFAAEYT